MKSHIQLEPSTDHANVIVCGAPERAELIASKLEDPTLIAKNREYHSYIGTHNNQKILVTSHGVGAPGAAICFQELINAGAKKIIRIGTAGGLYAETRIGDIVIATAAEKEDGVTRLMVPEEFRATADKELAQALSSALEKTPHKKGIVLTTDLFYPGPLGHTLEQHARNNILAVEMECSALFVIGTLRKIQTAAALILDGNPLKWEEGHYDPDPTRLKNSTEKCIEAALEALTSKGNAK